MNYFLVPFHPRQNEVLIWAGFWAPSGNRPPLDLVLFIDRSEYTRRPLQGTWPALGRHEGTTGFRYRAELFQDLPANTRFRCALVNTNTGAEVEAGYFDTLPVDLPRPTGQRLPSLVVRPFTLMLGSCYWDSADNGEVSAAYRKVFAYSAYSPHVKLLVGDQVYIDQPWWDWEDPTISIAEMREKVTSRYHSAWSKLSPLLKGGANICTSDDHEFWNDFPFQPLPVWLGLQNASVRRRLAGETNNFARSMQQIVPSTQFNIGDHLSVFVLDTRINRTESNFALENDLRAFEDWVANLRCPGVLAVGQPLLGERVGHPFGDLGPDKLWKAGAAVVGGLFGGIPGALIGLFGIDIAKDNIEGIIGDHNLPFYKAQYRRLTQALARSRHDIVVLSGDIHLGRIARTRIHRADGSDPTRIYEVIASPMTVLSTGPIGTQETDNPEKHPVHFPVDVSLTAPEMLTGVVDYPKHLPARTGERPPDHFMTLSFQQGTEPGSVRVSVRAWLVREAGTANLPKRAWTYSFDLDTGRLPAEGQPVRRAVLSVMTDPDGDIIALCNPNESWSPRLRHEVIADIENGRAEYYVAGYPGQQPGTGIHVVRDPGRHLAYLRTDPDDVAGNNLDNLPRLRTSDWH